MQASQAPNETRLPRALVRQNEALKAKYGADREPKQDPAVDTPPATPSAEAATNADTHPQVQAPAGDPRETSFEYWKQRFKVTSGVLEAERRERKAEKLDVQRQMTEMQEQIRSLQAAQPSAKPDVTAYFTPEQVEELGPEQTEAIVKTAKKLAQEAVEAEIKPLREKQARDQNDAAKDRQTQFLEQLAELVPDFQEIDSSDEWKLWLAEDDDSTGLERQAVLTSHLQRGDARKVAKMFDTYRKTSAPSVPVPPVAPRGSGATPQGQTPRPSAALTAPNEAEIKAFYVRAATKRKGQPGFVTDQERATFEARMKLRGRR